MFSNRQGLFLVRQGLGRLQWALCFSPNQLATRANPGVWPMGNLGAGPHQHPKQAPHSTLSLGHTYVGGKL